MTTDKPEWDDVMREPDNSEGRELLGLLKDTPDPTDPKRPERPRPMRTIPAQ